MTDDQRTYRLGAILTATAAIILLFTVPNLFQIPWHFLSVLLLVVPGLMIFVGVGIMRTNIPSEIGVRRAGRFSRWSGVALFAVMGLMSIVQVAQLLIVNLRHAGSLTPQQWTTIANASCTSLLLVWLSWRAITLLTGWRPIDQQRGFRITVFLTGLALISASASHLWIAAHTAEWSSGSFSVSLSPGGIVMYGFFGWPIWHGCTLIVGLLFFCGWRKGQRWAALALSALCVLAIPLVMIKAWIATFDARMILLVGIPLVLMAYLSWWMARELGDASSPTSPSSTG